MTSKNSVLKGKKIPTIDGVLKHATLYLTLLFSLTALIIYFYLNALSNSQLKESAITKAQGYFHVLSVFRSLYTSEVVVKAKAQGMMVTHNYESYPNAIPLPATLSMLLGNKLGGPNSDIKSRLYSPYPFPWREPFAGLDDQFSKDAWQALQNSPQLAFYKFEEFEGKMSLRYARADIMRESCIQCHNSHPDTPKADWKLGEVRGVLEVVTPIDLDITTHNSVIHHTLLLLVVILFLAMLGIRSVLNRLELRRQEAKGLMAEAVLANTQLEKEIDERKRAQEKLLEVSLSDALTGVANRRKFDQSLEKEWRRARREEQHLCIVLLDVDFFKSYNDNYGHQAGDQVLHQLATAVDLTIHRASDLFCRYGGEEFVLLLADTNPEGGEVIAETVRAKVESLVIEHEFSSVAPVITVSLGVASLVPNALSSAEQLLKGADDALYEAKQAGRNRAKTHSFKEENL